MIQTKGFYLNTSLTINRSEEDIHDLGYTISIPWNDVTTAGWQNYNTDITGPIQMWGTENMMVMRDDPEFFAPDNVLRDTGGVPGINLNDPKYTYDRANYTRQMY